MPLHSPCNSGWGRHLTRKKALIMHRLSIISPRFFPRRINRNRSQLSFIIRFRLLPQLILSASGTCTQTIIVPEYLIDSNPLTFVSAQANLLYTGISDMGQEGQFIANQYTFTKSVPLLEISVANFLGVLPTMGWLIVVLVGAGIISALALYSTTGKPPPNEPKCGSDYQHRYRIAKKYRRKISVPITHICSKECPSYRRR